MNKEIIKLKDQLVKKMEKDKLFSLKQVIRAIELNGLCEMLGK